MRFHGLEQDERRRAPRVPGQFLVMVQGVDGGLVARRGDVSEVGVIFGADAMGLEVGSLEYLHLMSMDRTVGVVVMAQVARVVSIQSSTPGGPSEAVAFELLVRDPAQQAALRRLVDKLACALEPLVPIDAPAPAPAQGGVFSLNVTRLELEATWPVEVGETVQMVINSFGGQTRIPFEGVVKSVRLKPQSEGGARYVAHVRLMGAGVRGDGAQHSITHSIDLVMNDLMTALSTSDLGGDRTHLKGRLDRIPLTGLLGWFNMERISGRLALKDQAQAITLFLRDGDLVDVDPCFDADPRDVVAEALSWTQGRFLFVQGDVEREDRVGVPLHALLMDLAREADEAAQHQDLMVG